jgi:ribosomal protein S18 acetylase RimI-like enzyme
MPVSSIVVLVVLSLIFIKTAALVVSSPVAIGIDTPFVGSPPRKDQLAKVGTPRLVLRIRSTTENDLAEVASLLASASISADESQWNWKTSMQVLRTKSEMHTLLSSRLEAIKEAQQIAARDATPNVDRMKLLWSHHDFRRKVEKAATLAKEPHVLRSSDFCIPPDDPKALHHAMITAEDVTTGTIVGFCEIAMLAHPSSSQDEVEFIASAPTIVNLASSTRHRRRGIASSLLKSAKELVQRQWSSNEIALYVDSANKGAISLYSKHGFIPKDFSKRDGGELYLTASVR